MVRTTPVPRQKVSVQEMVVLQGARVLFFFGAQNSNKKSSFYHIQSIAMYVIFSFNVFPRSVQYYASLPWMMGY